MLDKWYSSMKNIFRKIRILFDIFCSGDPRFKNFLVGWLLVLGLEEGLVECATVCVKSWVILACLGPSINDVTKKSEFLTPSFITVFTQFLTTPRGYWRHLWMAPITHLLRTNRRIVCIFILICQVFFFFNFQETANRLKMS